MSTAPRGSVAGPARPHEYCHRLRRTPVGCCYEKSGREMRVPGKQPSYRDALWGSHRGQRPTTCRQASAQRSVEPFRTRSTRTASSGMRNTCAELEKKYGITYDTIEYLLS